jgi:pseudaminic acid biosynthesis-associated methylase
MTGRTEQEQFWAGDFGVGYIERNDDRAIVAGNVRLFSEALRGLKPSSALELGANIGLNLAALRVLYPSLELSAVEINSTAAQELSSRAPDIQVKNCSISEASFDRQFDLVLSKGVLIHLNPELLPDVYRKIGQWASRYVIFAEYYNPSPVAIPYRGHDDRLFKRDFAGEFLSLHPEFSLRDYGFVYRGDPAHPLDDITWFLMERTGQ